jgi:hypothetical protein
MAEGVALRFRPTGGKELHPWGGSRVSYSSLFWRTTHPYREVVTVRDLESRQRIDSKVKNVRTLRGGAALAFDTRDGQVWV